MALTPLHALADDLERIGKELRDHADKVALGTFSVGAPEAEPENTEEQSPS